MVISTQLGTAVRDPYMLITQTPPKDLVTGHIMALLYFCPCDVYIQTLATLSFRTTAKYENINNSCRTKKYLDK